MWNICGILSLLGRSRLPREAEYPPSGINPGLGLQLPLLGACSAFIAAALPFSCHYPDALHWKAFNILWLSFSSFFLVLHSTVSQVFSPAANSSGSGKSSETLFLSPDKESVSTPQPECSEFVCFSWRASNSCPFLREGTQSSVNESYGIDIGSCATQFSVTLSNIRNNKLRKGNAYFGSDF